MVPDPNWDQILKKECDVLDVSKFYIEKKISMLTDLKVPSLACKWVFYRPEHNVKEDPIELNFERLEMHK